MIGREGTVCFGPMEIYNLLNERFDDVPDCNRTSS